MSALALGPLVKVARAQALLTFIESTGNPCVLTFYEGTRPPTTSDPVDAGDTILAEVPMPSPFGTVVGDAVVSELIAAHQTTAGTGNANWARLTRSDGEVIADLSVGAEGSGSNIEMASTSFFPGVLVVLTPITIDEA